ncbi:ASCH domain-containing protein [Vreelandella venusta]|uniref:ASCH domain-containing protein n=1 Tax=Vreelandella venusta TaxID=44935 RepID=UPI003F66A0CF
MSTILISIKPVYCKDIYAGKKKIELRRRVGKKFSPGSEVYIYTTSPVKKITGKAKIAKILKGSPRNIKSLVLEEACVSSCYYDEYFFKYETAYAIFLESVTEYCSDEVISLEEMRRLGVSPPQSFCYIEKLS